MPGALGFPGVFPSPASGQTPPAGTVGAAATATPTAPRPRATPTIQPPTATRALPTATPAPTFTPVPTATPTPIVVTFQKGAQLYSDSFAAPVKWPLTSDSNLALSVLDGRYHVRVLPARYWGWQCAPNAQALSAVANLVMEVSAKVEEGPETSAYGLLFRFVDNKNFYRLHVTPAGKWEFGKFLNGTWSVISPLNVSDAIPKGNQTVTLRVVAKGNTFAFFANGVQLGTAADSSLGAGNLCLSTAAQGDGSVHVSYDDVNVWEAK